MEHRGCCVGIVYSDADTDTSRRAFRDPLYYSLYTRKDRQNGICMRLHAT